MTNQELMSKNGGDKCVEKSGHIIHQHLTGNSNGENHYHRPTPVSGMVIKNGLQEHQQHHHHLDDDNFVRSSSINRQFPAKQQENFPDQYLTTKNGCGNEEGHGNCAFARATIDSCLENGKPAVIFGQEPSVVKNIVQDFEKRGIFATGRTLQQQSNCPPALVVGQQKTLPGKNRVELTNDSKIANIIKPRQGFGGPKFTIHNQQPLNLPKSDVNLNKKEADEMPKKWKKFLARSESPPKVMADESTPIYMVKLFTCYY